MTAPDPNSATLHDSIHVWRIPLDQPASTVESCHSVLDAAERERAGRFQFPELRRRFIVAHGAVRFLLAAYLDQPPASLAFGQNAFGKPHLTGSGRPVFNLTHSHELALLAVAADGDIGIDVEHAGLSRPASPLDLARRFFAPEEYRGLAGLEGASLDAAFLACWTRKEAYIKALGTGLSLSLASFSVETDPARPAALLACPERPEDVAAFGLRDLEPAPGYRGCLAYRGRSHGTPRVFDWCAPRPAQRNTATPM